MERIIKGIFIPLEVWQAKELSWNEKVLLMEIDSFTSKDIPCYFSNAYIAELLDIKEDTASRLVNSLIKKGYIRQTGFDGRKRYLASCIEIRCRLGEKSEADSEKNPMQTRKNLPHNIEDNKIITNTPLYSSPQGEDSKRVKFDFRKAMLEAGVTPEVADTWMQVRKSRKAVNSELAWNEVAAQIEKSGLSADECIRIAAANSWRGFKAEWISKTSARCISAGSASRPSQEANPLDYDFSKDY